MTGRRYAQNNRICTVGAGLDETSEVDQNGGYRAFRGGLAVTVCYEPDSGQAQKFSAGRSLVRPEGSRHGEHESVTINTASAFRQLVSDRSVTIRSNIQHLWRVTRNRSGEEGEGKSVESVMRAGRSVACRYSAFLMIGGKSVIGAHLPGRSVAGL